MLGPSLLVAPVLQEGAAARTVYLPAGTDWFDAYTDTRYIGGINASVAAPLERIPLFVRAGAVVPKGPAMQFADEQPLRDIRVQLYPGPETTFHLYEDDGASFDYARGAYLDTSITRRDTASGMSCRIERGSGAWSPPAGRSWWLELHAFGAPSSVTANGASLAQAASEAALGTMSQGWVRRDDGRVIVRVADAATAIDVVVLTP
jgi:hypothetical protein